MPRSPLQDVARVCLTLLASLGCTVASSQDEPAVDMKPVPIYLEIAPADLPGKQVLPPGQILHTLAGVPLRIEGVTSHTFSGKQVRVTVTPPQETSEPDGPEAESRCPQDNPAELVATGRIKPLPPITLVANVNGSGDFAARYTPEVLGEHEVVAALAEHRGEGRFEVVEAKPAEECDEIPRDEIQKEADALVKNVCALMPLLRARSTELPASPAKDEFLEKLKAFEQAVREGSPCDKTPEWVAGIDSVTALQRQAPFTRPAVQGLVHEFKGWLSVARRANEQAPKALAQLESGNVFCDQMDIVVNGLKFCDFFLGLATKPGAFMIDWAKENVPTKLLGMAPPIKRSPALKDSIELLWKGVVSFHGPAQKGFESDVDQRTGFDREFGKRAAAHKMAYNVLAFAGARLFEAYCQTFQGPVKGAMRAEFKHEDKIWWTYNIEMSGELVLRYPKNAKGDAIALTGEFMGNGTLFKSWDNAIPIIFPELAQGTVFRNIARLEPLSMGDFPNLLGDWFKDRPVGGGLELPDANPISSTIDQGGAITKNIMTPAFFRVPVRGDLRGDTLRLELQQAATDFDDARTKVIKIMVPVLSNGWPQLSTYALPYKGARFMLFRAMHDGPLEFTVQRAGKTMVIERKLKRERSADDTRGLYDVSIKACNPGCSSGAPPSGDNSKKM